MINFKKFSNIINIQSIIDNKISISYLDYTQSTEDSNNPIDYTSNIFGIQSPSVILGLKVFNTSKELEYKQQNISENDVEKQIIGHFIKLCENNINDVSNIQSIASTFDFIELQKSNSDIDYLFRKFLSRMNMISNFVATNTRIGPANTILMNSQLKNELNSFFRRYVLNSSYLSDFLSNKIGTMNIETSEYLNYEKIIIYRLDSNISNKNTLLVHNDDMYNIITYSDKNQNYVALNINFESLNKKRLKKIKFLYD